MMPLYLILQFQQLSEEMILAFRYSVSSLIVNEVQLNHPVAQWQPPLADAV